MPRPVTVGLNGTPASLAAAAWGAREASIRHLPLRLVSAWEWQPYSHAPLSGTEMPEQWSRRLPEEAAAQLTHRFPDLDISTKQLTGPPPEMLCREAAEAELLAIGTAGLGALTGFLMGSVAMATVAHTHRPVVLVRPEGTPPCGRRCGPRAARSGGGEAGHRRSGGRLHRSGSHHRWCTAVRLRSGGRTLRRPADRLQLESSGGLRAGHRRRPALASRYRGRRSEHGALPAGTVVEEVPRSTCE